MRRNDTITIFVVSFIAGVVLSNVLVALLDLHGQVAVGVGCLCAAAVAAFIYRRQIDRRW